jgi:DNA-binding MarR family transcriptional regulator
VSIPPVPAELPRRPVVRTANRLHTVAIRLLRAVRTADELTGLSAPRLSLLSVLVFGGPAAVSELARIEQVSAPAVTKLVDGLERDGLAVRQRSTEDRRVVLVAATAAGRALLEQGRAARVAAVADLLAGLTRTELAVLDEAVGLLAGQLGID